MPSGFEIGSGGFARLSSPYTNNVHPDDHAELINVIPPHEGNPPVRVGVIRLSS
jgi:hypothetical protein